MQTWQVQDCLDFLSMCRAYKPLLAAQRQQSTLVSILDFLMPIVTSCSTGELSTLLLDLAFIGCQSFKVHSILSELSTELYGRIQSGALTKDNAVELADAIRALDKLDHCHDALSRSAGKNTSRVIATSVPALLAPTFCTVVNTVQLDKHCDGHVQVPFLQMAIFQPST